LKSFFCLLLSLIGCTVASGQDSTQQPTVPQPTMLQSYVATYSASFRGIDGGTLRMELRRDPATGHYTFETRANPTVLASFFVSSNAFERTTLEVAATGLRPIGWEADDGRSGVKNDGKLQFNWQEHNVSGSFEGKPVSLPLAEGTAELQTIQLAAMFKMQNSQEPTAFAVVNGDKIQEYSYARVGTETLDTKLGKLDTTIYESARKGSSRVSRIWHAPSLGFVPVKAEQIRKGKVETVLILITLKRDQDQ
jgi:hypothetical protein